MSRVVRMWKNSKCRLVWLYWAVILIYLLHPTKSSPTDSQADNTESIVKEATPNVNTAPVLQKNEPTTTEIDDSSKNVAPIPSPPKSDHDISPEYGNTNGEVRKIDSESIKEDKQGNSKQKELKTNKFLKDLEVRQNYDSTYPTKRSKKHKFVPLSRWKEEKMQLASQYLGNVNGAIHTETPSQPPPSRGKVNSIQEKVLEDVKLHDLGLSNVKEVLIVAERIEEKIVPVLPTSAPSNTDEKITPEHIDNKDEEKILIRQSDDATDDEIVKESISLLEPLTVDTNHEEDLKHEENELLDDIETLEEEDLVRESKLNTEEEKHENSPPTSQSTAIPEKNHENDSSIDDLLDTNDKSPVIAMDNRSFIDLTSPSINSSFNDPNTSYTHNVTSRTDGNHKENGNTIQERQCDGNLIPDPDFCISQPLASNECKNDDKHKREVLLTDQIVSKEVEVEKKESILTQKSSENVSPPPASQNNPNGQNNPNLQNNPNGQGNNANMNMRSARRRLRKNRLNYASYECGAKVLASNPEAVDASVVLMGSKDRYMLNPCSAPRQWIVVELCEEVGIDHIRIGNFEFFSSMIKDIQILGSNRYPTHTWAFLGNFTMANERELQSLDFGEESELNPEWFKYIKIRILSHWGKEYYCPITEIQVHGLPYVEKLQQQLIQNTEEVHHLEMFFTQDADESGEFLPSEPSHMHGNTAMNTNGIDVHTKSINGDSNGVEEENQSNSVIENILGTDTFASGCTSENCKDSSGAYTFGADCAVKRSLQKEPMSKVKSPLDSFSRDADAVIPMKEYLEKHVGSAEEYYDKIYNKSLNIKSQQYNGVTSKSSSIDNDSNASESIDDDSRSYDIVHEGLPSPPPRIGGDDELEDVDDDDNDGITNEPKPSMMSGASAIPTIKLMQVIIQRVKSIEVNQSAISGYLGNISAFYQGQFDEMSEAIFELNAYRNRFLDLISNFTSSYTAMERNVVKLKAKAKRAELYQEMMEELFHRTLRSYLVFSGFLFVFIFIVMGALLVIILRCIPPQQQQVTAHEKSGTEKRASSGIFVRTTSDIMLDSYFQLKPDPSSTSELSHHHQVTHQQATHHPNELLLSLQANSTPNLVLSPSSIANNNNNTSGTLPIVQPTHKEPISRHIRMKSNEL